MAKEKKKITKKHFCYATVEEISALYPEFQSATAYIDECKVEEITGHDFTWYEDLKDNIRSKSELYDILKKCDQSRNYKQNMKKFLEREDPTSILDRINIAIQNDEDLKEFEEKKRKLEEDYNYEDKKGEQRSLKTMSNIKN